MSEVIILFNGFAYMDPINKSVMKANCSSVLVKSKNSNIIIDTMTAWDKDILIAELLKHNITPDDINIVVCTHGHSDHTGNNNLFLKAKHIVGQSISFMTDYYLHDFTKESYKINNDVIVQSTPGHTFSCVSVIVRNAVLPNITQQTTVAITGDLFENSSDVVNETIWLEAGSEMPHLQRKNRYEIAKIVEYIVPGHGEIFFVTDEIRKKLEFDLLRNCAVK